MILSQISKTKRIWDHNTQVIGRWEGETIIMGDFNEVRCQTERYRLIFNASDASCLTIL